MVTLLLLAALGAAVPPAAVPLPPAVRDAVVSAVRARLGGAAEVDVEAKEAPAPLTGEIVDAVLAPGAAIGAPLRVVLRGRGQGPAVSFVPVGRATVRIGVTLPHLHTARVVRRGERLADADVAEVSHALPRGALRALPDRQSIVAGRVLRDLPVGACLTAQVVVPVPAVVAGQDVAAVVRDGRVEVRARLVAVDSGAIGDTVRVSHPEARRVLRARVVGRAEVEIHHER
jgi:flagella basal body P-ring formation protein FlgA